MTDCARCGDCCDPVFITADQLEFVFGGPTWSIPAPGSQRAWLRKHLHFRRFAGRAEGREGPGAEFSCDYFDVEARQCTAYDDRPQMCRDYPFYGRDPKADSTMGGRCSFLADVPGITMLPIVAVR